jgi:1,4-alpha-glucan branching enzyme
VGVPRPGLWIETLNTNAKRYGGDGAGHGDPLKTTATKWDGRPHAVDVNLPGMTTMFFLFRPMPETAESKPDTKPDSK